MSTLEQLIQDTKERCERDIARQEGELIALERDMNKTGERYGHNGNHDTNNGLCSDSHSDSEVDYTDNGLDAESAHKRAGERTEKMEERG